MEKILIRQHKKWSLLDSENVYGTIRLKDIKYVEDGVVDVEDLTRLTTNNRQIIVPTPLLYEQGEYRYYRGYLVSEDEVRSWFQLALAELE